MFTFRYNAMIYPLVAAMAIILSPQKSGIKLAGIIFGLILMVTFIGWSGHAAKKSPAPLSFRRSSAAGNGPTIPRDLLASEVANFFLRHPEAPLKQYRYSHFPAQSDLSYAGVQARGRCAVAFDRYGKFLIKRHPPSPSPDIISSSIPEHAAQQMGWLANVLVKSLK